MFILDFQDGTLLLTGEELLPESVTQYMIFDNRVKKYRAKAEKYQEIIFAFRKENLQLKDNVPKFQTIDLNPLQESTARDYQEEAVKAWKEHHSQGVIVLPTGTGKTHVAMMVLNEVKLSTLIVVPTIDLMNQWSESVEKYFGVKTGMLGGGLKEIRDITISTYNSAYLMMDFIGSQFGLIIFDECHHLPGPANRHIANMCIAPNRLGLTATPERQDGEENELYILLGEVCYRKDIVEMENKFLAPYFTKVVELHLDEEECLAYTENREIYISFIRQNSINFSQPQAWGRFIALCARSEHGKKAFRAYLAQKKIARTAKAKFKAIWKIFRAHAGERILIFTADNDTAYAIGKCFHLPVLTHHTKGVERKKYLQLFREGIYPILVTSKVLNEGIDVPEASVGIIVSGSGSIREHVQRLGRILRPSTGKQAMLYELVSVETSEFQTSERRREHSAYKRSD